MSPYLEISSSQKSPPKAAEAAESVVGYIHIQLIYVIVQVSLGYTTRVNMQTKGSEGDLKLTRYSKTRVSDFSV